MTQAAQDLLNAFDRLSEAERREVVYELLKRARKFDYPDLDDETLAQIADELWQLYDAEEAEKDLSIGSD
jgi:hypothetical protein